MGSGTVFACTRVLAESVASLPLITYRRDGRTKERAKDHPVYRLLHLQPNPEMTSFSLRELMMKYLCLWGNAICEIDWGNDGYPRALWPLPVQRIGIERLANKTLRYWYDPEDGGPRQPIARRNILHIRFMGSGWWGDSPVRLGLRSLGLDLAAEEYGSRYFANGARPGLILKHPGILSDKAYENLKGSWASEHQGLSNAHRMRILEEGMDVATIGSPPDEAQFLQTRRFQRATIASWYKVPLHKLNDYDGGASYASAEVMQKGFYDDTLLPWLTRIEQELTVSLLMPSEQEDVYVEHLADALLRADTAERYQAYQVAIQSGVMSPNEVRERENLNPYEGGDVYLLPLNMIAADQAAQLGQDDSQDDAGDDDAEGEDRAAHLDHHERCTCGECDGLAVARETRQGEPSADQEDLAVGRRRLAGTYVRLFEDGVGRLLKRELADLRRSVEKYLVKGQDLNAWNDWLEEFYEDLRGVIPGYLQATMATLAEQMAAAVAAEQGEDVDPAALDEFVGEYLDTYAGGYVAGHHRQLKALRDEALTDGVPVDERIRGRLDGWEETETDRQAREQAFEALNALTVAAYSIVGVRYLMWMSAGESCPFCRAMSGRIAGIDAYFVEAGGSVTGTDGAVLTIAGNRRHGPLHSGCDCVVIAL